MKRWFTGDVIAHYRGQRTQGLLPQSGAEHFELEVYRALIRNVRLLGDTPLAERAGSAEEGDAPPTSQPPLTPRRGRNGAERGRHEGQRDGAEGQQVASEVASPGAPAPEVNLHPPVIGPAFCQAHIPIAHFVDVQGPGHSIRGSARDVRISEFRLSHPASQGRVSYGRIEGKISGWFEPPPPLEVEELSPPPAARAVGWKSENIDTTIFGLTPGRDEGEARDELRFPAHHREPEVPRPAARADDGASSFPSRPPTSRKTSEGPSSAPKRPPGLAQPEGRTNPDHAPQRPIAGDPPFFAAGTAVAVALLFLATPSAAAIWSVAFLIAFGLRKWLIGVIPDVSGVRLLVVVGCGGQLLVTALLLASWSSAGCIALSPLPLLLLLGGMFVASLLPRPLASATTAALFALVLFQAYGFWAAPFCS